MTIFKECVKIRVFDDGYQNYDIYHNVWYIKEKMYGGGKLHLINCKDSKITIPSISAWKTLPLN